MREAASSASFVPDTNDTRVYACPCPNAGCGDQCQSDLDIAWRQLYSHVDHEELQHCEFERHISPVEWIRGGFAYDDDHIPHHMCQYGRPDRLGPGYRYCQYAYSDHYGKPGSDRAGWQLDAYLVFDQCYQRYLEWCHGSGQRIAGGISHGDYDLYLRRQRFHRRNCNLIGDHLGNRRVCRYERTMGPGSVMAVDGCTRPFASKWKSALLAFFR